MSNERRNALAPGTEFEGYQIDSILGAGGFGITYKATEVLLDRTVAIKEFLPSGIVMREADGLGVTPLGKLEAEDYAWGKERFRTEAQTLVAFRHPNIVSVHRYFETNGTGYLVMEYVDGQTLAEMLAPDRTLSEDDIHRILDPLLEGLEAVHALGFLHRDIKPANIFVRDDGTPVLIDFGAARQALGQHSKSLTAIISEGYAPYEQYDSSGDQGTWTDIYALGGVLYRCVTGIRPPDAPSRISAMVRGKDDPMPPAAETAGPGYSRELLAAIDMALSIREEDRPQTVAALRAEITPEPETAVAPAPPADAPAAEATPSAPGGDETLLAGADAEGAPPEPAPDPVPTPPKTPRQEAPPQPPAATGNLTLIAGADSDPPAADAAGAAAGDAAAAPLSETYLDPPPAEDGGRPDAERKDPPASEARTPPSAEHRAAPPRAGDAAAKPKDEPPPKPPASTAGDAPPPTGRRTRRYAYAAVALVLAGGAAAAGLVMSESNLRKECQEPFSSAEAALGRSEARNAQDYLNIARARNCSQHTIADLQDRVNVLTAKKRQEEKRERRRREAERKDAQERAKREAEEKRRQAAARLIAACRNLRTQAHANIKYANQLATLAQRGRNLGCPPQYQNRLYHLLHFRYGSNAYSARRYAEGINHFTNALRFGQTEGAYGMRGLCYLRQRNFNAAYNDFTSAIRRNPRSYRAYYHRGLTLYWMKRRAEAIADVRRSLQIKPDYEIAKRLLRRLEN